MSPRVRDDSMHPLLQSRPSGRPLNFTVRRHKRDASVAAAFAVVLVCFVLAIGVVAALCAKFHWYKGYVIYVSALTIVGIVAVHVSQQHYVPGARGLLASIASILPLGAAYLFPLGTMVRRAAAPRSVIAASFILTLVAIPLWFAWATFISCTIGQDCL